MIHYFVVCKNTDGAYGECSEKGYNEKLSKAFKTIRGKVRCKGHKTLSTKGCVNPIRAGLTQHQNLIKME